MRRGLPPTWKIWKSQRIKNLFKKSGNLSRKLSCQGKCHGN